MGNFLPAGAECRCGRDDSCDDDNALHVFSPLDSRQSPYVAYRRGYIRSRKAGDWSPVFNLIGAQMPRRFSVPTPSTLAAKEAGHKQVNKL
jgi:hypothetical protein